MDFLACTDTMYTGKTHAGQEIRVLAGPTAVGKTALAIELAKRWDAEIVSADAIAIYKRLDIGSAKPTPEEQQGIAHHMLSVVDPERNDYSVAVYREEAMRCIDDILRRGKLPLVVGGTGLYIDALTRPMVFGEAADEAYRAELMQQELSEQGSLHARLARIDEAAAARIHPNDLRRTIRALEVHKLTGRRMSEQIERTRQQRPPYRSRIVALNTEREELYRRIERRVHEMMRSGLLEEARALYDSGLGASHKAMQGLGYKQLVAHFQGECTLEEAVDDIVRETRRFAKRQLTWLRRDARVSWLDPLDYATLQALVHAAEACFERG